MAETMVIASRLRDYQVDFVDDCRTPLAEEAAQGSFFIVDRKVYRLYRDRLAGILPEHRTLLIEANETNKTLERCRDYIELLVEKNIRRDNRLVAIGGGVIQDITSFIASILYRGIEWAFVPTTLLAQADSCIGSKTSINLGDKKNLVGNFYPPVRIYHDPAFLASLPIGEIKSGLGEMLHFYFYAGSPMIERVAREYEQLIQDHTRLVDFIKESLAIKKSVIEVDEFDQGERNKFNYGHTFGHALETLTDYGISHGQAVTLGMDLANYLSRELGFMTAETFDYLHTVLRRNIPVFAAGEYDMNVYLAALARDKKNVGTDLVCILAEDKGKLFKKKLVYDDTLKNMIISYFK